MQGLPWWATDDPEITGAIRLLRRVPRDLVHDGEIEKSNFDEREPGQGLSVTAWAVASDLDDVLRRHEDFGIVCVPADAFRNEGALIVRVPLVGNLNHCEVYPRLKGGQCKRIKRLSLWVYYPDWVEHQHTGPVETFG